MRRSCTIADQGSCGTTSCHDVTTTSSLVVSVAAKLNGAQYVHVHYVDKTIVKLKSRIWARMHLSLRRRCPWLRLASTTLRLRSNDCGGMHSSHVSVKVVFATERPMASCKSAVHVLFLGMNTFVVSPQVRPETKQFRSTAAHCASILFVVGHRKMFTRRCQ